MRLIDADELIERLDKEPYDISETMWSDAGFSFAKVERIIAEFPDADCMSVADVSAICDKHYRHTDDDCGDCPFLTKKKSGTACLFEKIPLSWDLDAIHTAERHGEWIDMNGKRDEISHYGYGHGKCSNCGKVEWLYEGKLYCPNCGARMRV